MVKITTASEAAKQDREKRETEQAAIADELASAIAAGIEARGGDNKFSQADAARWLRVYRHIPKPATGKEPLRSHVQNYATATCHGTDNGRDKKGKKIRGITG